LKITTEGEIMDRFLTIVLTLHFLYLIFFHLTDFVFVERE